MTKVIGVRFKSSARIYYFDPAAFEVKPGDGVIVETARGQEFADVVQGITEVADTMIVSPLKPVIRLASEQDRSMRAQNSGKEDEAFSICQKKIAQHGLDMKLVDVEYSFNGSKVVFYFTADERVDFRELVKDLASQFKTRIELRQIGVRDEAKMLGGLGSCGRPVCCKTFLDDFRPVSIKMAKEQNLSLSPTKISGLCGRLMCCLQYEQASYEEMKQKMPRVNREVLTPDGPGTAIENNAITEKTRVRLTLPDGSIDVREYHYSLLAKPGEPLPQSVVDARARAAENAQPAAPVQAVPAAATAAAPVQAQRQGTDENRQANKRRRRGGRGRTGYGEGTDEQQNQPQARQQDAPRQQRPQGGGTQPRQPRAQGDGTQPRDNRPRQDGGQQRQGRPQQRPNANVPPEKPVGEGQDTAQTETHRRRRRRSNKPRTEGAPKAE